MIGNKWRWTTIGIEPNMNDELYEWLDEIAVKWEPILDKNERMHWIMIVWLTEHEKHFSYPTELLIMNVHHTRTNIVSIIDIAAHQEQKDSLRELSNMEAKWKLPIDLMCNFGNQVLKILDERRIRSMLWLEDYRYLMPIEELTPILQVGWWMSMYIDIHNDWWMKEIIEAIRKQEEWFAKDMRITINWILSQDFRAQKMSWKIWKIHPNKKAKQMEARYKQRVKFHWRWK